MITSDNDVSKTDGNNLISHVVKRSLGRPTGRWEGNVKMVSYLNRLQARKE